MATVTTTTLLDGSKYIVLHVHVDTSPDALDAIIYDYSADTNNPRGTESSARLIEAWYWGHNGMDAEIEFDGTTDFPLVHLPRDVTDHQVFESIGGIPNKATNPTGDITITTTGLTSTEHIQIILKVAKY